MVCYYQDSNSTMSNKSIKINQPKLIVRVVVEGYVSSEHLMMRHTPSGNILPYASISEDADMREYHAVKSLTDVSNNSQVTHISTRILPNTLWVTEFGDDYKVPQWITNKYYDISYHNDECPRFTVKEFCDLFEICIPSLWVGHIYSTRRTDEGARRYRLSDSEGETWLETDDEDYLIHRLPVWEQEMKDKIT